MRSRILWKRCQRGWDPARLVFIDESGAKTNMTRLRGRSLKGSRLNASAPSGHWQTTTMIGAVRLDGSTACMAIEGATNTEVFRAFVSKILIPQLRPNDIVVMDNLSAHKSEPTLELIRKVGAEVIFLPPYSPDLNPIEKMWSKIKNSLRSTAARDLQNLINAIALALNKVSAQDAIGWFNSCGYNII